MRSLKECGYIVQIFLQKTSSWANDWDLYLETEIKSYNQIDYSNMEEISLNCKGMKN